MRVYLTVFTTTIKEYFTYRLNFILWRLRSFLNLIVIFFLWNSVLINNNSFGSYDKDTMLTYILYTNFLISFVMGTRTAEIAGEINNGNIVNLLLKPVSFFRFYFLRDLADKAINIFFAFFEMMILVVAFRLTLKPPQNLLLFLLLFANGTFIAFFVNLMLSFIGFWTTEVWAPRFVFYMAVSFLSGSYFPLDLLPPLIYRLLLFTPFPYLYYLPSKIALGQTSNLILSEIVLSFFWVFFGYFLTKVIWSKGMKSFSFWGR